MGHLELDSVLMWEKCDRYGVRVEFNDSPLKMPRERDKWLMREFVLSDFGRMNWRDLIG